MNNPLVQVDPGLFIWTIVTFLVLLTLLAKFAWGPLLQALAAREETIRKSLADAEKARLELERLNQESEAIIRQARVEAESIIGASRADAERLRGELREKARSRGRRHRQERRAPDSAGNRARARADPPRGRRPLGGDRVEAHSEEHHEGRQRAADRRRAEATSVVDPASVSGPTDLQQRRRAPAICRGGVDVDDARQQL